jgi:hypothetical protein
MTKITTQYKNKDKEIYGLEKAVATSWSTLTNQGIDEVVNRTLCFLGDTSDTFIIRFLGEDYNIQFKERSITMSNGKPFHNLFKIGIILHYLVYAKDKPIANRLISFRELWGGNEYYSAFDNRVLKPLTSYFAKKPELLIDAGCRVGGEAITKGDYGISIPALPRVPLTILFWTGDEEVQPAANVLFDSSANEQMETEALVWLAIATVSELKARSNK